jgi:hypothetical protein
LLFILTACAQISSRRVKKCRDGNRCPRVRVSHYPNQHPKSPPKPKEYSGGKITPTPTPVGFGFFHPNPNP